MTHRKFQELYQDPTITIVIGIPAVYRTQYFPMCNCKPVLSLKKSLKYLSNLILCSFFKILGRNGMLELNPQNVFLSVDKHTSLSTRIIQADVHHVTARRSIGNQKDKFKSTVWKFLHHSQASFKVSIQYFDVLLKTFLNFILKNNFEIYSIFLELYPGWIWVEIRE